MKIGEYVKRHINLIFSHCDNVGHDEIHSLIDKNYSKQVFGIGFPFCTEVDNIDKKMSKRYWRDTFLVRSKLVRVSSQWVDTMGPAFKRYLESKEIAPLPDLDESGGSEGQIVSNKSSQPPSSRSNSRFRGNAIGNAQNQFIRNILSSLGVESFNEDDWISTKEYFSHKCAYCGLVTDLQMEHAIPINKGYLGEHRLGNLVPSCNPCNSKKGGRDFRQFLEDKAEFIQKIEEYMDSRNYVPLEDSKQMKHILEMAHKEIAMLADRYISIINELFPQSRNAESNQA